MVPHVVTVACLREMISLVVELVPDAPLSHEFALHMVALELEFLIYWLRFLYN